MCKVDLLSLEKEILESHDFRTKSERKVEGSAQLFLISCDFIYFIKAIDQTAWRLSVMGYGQVVTD